MQFKTGQLKFEMTQADFVDWLDHAQEGKVPTSASIREAAIFWAGRDGAVFTDESLDAVVREYEARFGVMLLGLAA